MQFRTKLLLAALAGTGALVYFAPPADEGSVATGSQRGSQRTIDPARPGAQTAAGERTPPSLPARAAPGDAAGNPFEQHSWLPPPPPPSSLPPAAPAPPPLKYRYAGAVVSGGKVQYFLATGDRIVPVSVGQDLGDGYRVESIAGNEIVFRYVPLGSTSRIQIQSTIAPGGPAVAPGPKEGTAPKPRPSAADAASTRLEWKAPAQAMLGAEFEVSLRISSTQRIASMPFAVGFNPEDMELVEVRPGSAFPAADSARYFSYSVDMPGIISVAATNPAGAPLSGAELLEMTFRPLRNGVTAELWVSSLELQDSTGSALPHEDVRALRIALRP